MDATVNPSLGSVHVHPGCDRAGLIHAALTSDDLRNNQPESVLFAWLVDLPKQLDPAAAASALLAAYPGHPRFRAGRFQAHMLRLLGEVSEWPQERLKPRRRGGRRGRCH